MCHARVNPSHKSYISIQISYKSNCPKPVLVVVSQLKSMFRVAFAQQANNRAENIFHC